MTHLTFRQLSWALCSIAMLGALPGCNLTDPYRRAGVWRPNDANSTNLSRMVEVPSDLVYGAGDNAGDGNMAALALTRLRADKVKPLPDSLISQVKTSSSNSAAGAQ